MHRRGTFVHSPSIARAGARRLPFTLGRNLNHPSDEELHTIGARGRGWVVRLWAVSKTITVAGWTDGQSGVARDITDSV